VHLRVLLCLCQVSGEALMGAQGFGVDPEVLLAVSEEVAAASRVGVRIAIVVSDLCWTGMRK
jgi:uridylate kinase